MSRLALTLAGWLLVALAFARLMRWLRGRPEWRADVERGAPPPAPAGPPLAATRTPLPASLEPHRAALEALLAPAAQLAPGAPTVARLGGAVRLPEGAEWPRSPSRPMSFVGELDLAALRAAAPEATAALPDEGTLALFYDVEAMPWGYEPGHAAFFRVLHLEGPVAERGAPPGATVFPERRLGARPTRVLPDPGDLPAEVRLAAPEADYARHAAALVAEPDHRVGGHARWVQEDARSEAAVAAAGGPAAAPEATGALRARLGAAASKVWRLLWQIDSDEEAGFLWGDGGRLYLLARDEDLKARRFDRVWLVLQGR